MKTFAIVLGSLALAVVLVAAGLWAGTAWAQGRWASDAAGFGPMGHAMMGYGWNDESTGSPQDLPCGELCPAYGTMDGNWDGDEMPCDSAQDMPCDSAQDMPCGKDGQACGVGGYGMMGPGMMGGSWDGDEMPCGGAYTTPGEGPIASLEGAETAVLAYVERQGYTGLEVTEVMEFELNYYAIVAEKDTGIGAMELLVDKASGAVGPEHGPNMMWNAKYGMMGRGWGGGMMRGSATGEMTLSPQEAREAAQRWLDANLPGRTAGEADPFYGYYTFHFLNDGKIEGMLSVHGSSGDVWYHSWHGDFIAMSEDHD